MYKDVYDPSNKTADAFNMDNMDEGENNKILTAQDQTLQGIKDFEDGLKTKGVQFHTLKNDSDYSSTVVATSPSVNFYKGVKDAEGNIYAIQIGDSDIYKITPEGTITNPYVVGSSPIDIVIDNGGNLFVCLLGDNVVEKIDVSAGTRDFRRPKDVV